MRLWFGLVWYTFIWRREQEETFLLPHFFTIPPHCSLETVVKKSNLMSYSFLLFLHEKRKDGVVLVLLGGGLIWWLQFNDIRRLIFMGQQYNAKWSNKMDRSLCGFVSCNQWNRQINLTQDQWTALLGTFQFTPRNLFILYFDIRVFHVCETTRWSRSVHHQNRDCLKY